MFKVRLDWRLLNLMFLVHHLQLAEIDWSFRILENSNGYSL